MIADIEKQKGFVIVAKYLSEIFVSRTTASLATSRVNGKAAAEVWGSFEIQ